MVFALLIPLRIAQGILALVVLSLSAYVAFWYNRETLSSSPTQINFLIFVPIFSFISILYLEITPRYVPKASHPYGHLAFETANLLFYVGGFAALTIFLNKLLFCRGPVCAAARADVVFSAFGWILWVGSTTMLTIEIFKGGLIGKSETKGSSKTIKNFSDEIDA